MCLGEDGSILFFYIKMIFNINKLKKNNLTLRLSLLGQKVADMMACLGRDRGNDAV